MRIAIAANIAKRSSLQVCCYDVTSRPLHIHSTIVIDCRRMNAFRSLNSEHLSFYILFITLHFKTFFK